MRPTPRALTQQGWMQAHRKLVNNRVGSNETEGSKLTRYRYESFAGFRLLVHSNDLTDEGDIIRTKYTRDGAVVTFTSATGKHSFYYHGEKSAVELSRGKWHFPGDFQHWAYVVDQETYQRMVLNHEVQPKE